MNKNFKIQLFNPKEGEKIKPGIYIGIKRSGKIFQMLSLIRDLEQRGLIEPIKKHPPILTYEEILKNTTVEKYEDNEDDDEMPNLEKVN